LLDLLKFLVSATFYCNLGQETTVNQMLKTLLHTSASGKL